MDQVTSGARLFDAQTTPRLACPKGGVTETYIHVSKSDTIEEAVTSIGRTGYHRTVREHVKRRNGKEQASSLLADHLIRWILADAKRLADFNAALATRFPKLKVMVTKFYDFTDELKENQTIEACATSGVVAANIVRILRDKLTKRNIAAHPSNVVVVQSQADDAITDLVNNVVLALK